LEGPASENICSCMQCTLACAVAACNRYLPGYIVI